MILHVYAVRDSALDAFNNPFFVPAPGLALRSFTDEVNRKDSELGAHATDYVLFKLGCFDSETGSFDCTRPEQVLRAVDVLTT